jgi:hypothetical protein
VVAAHDIDRSSHPVLLGGSTQRLGRLRLHLKRELGVHVAAVIAGTVGELGAAALGTTDVVNRLERVMRAALSLAGFTDALDGLHGIVFQRRNMRRGLS